MPTVQLIRIFVSSPGDCVDERVVLDEVVRRVNETSGRADLRFELIKWERSVVPQIGPPPQQVVDSQTPEYGIYLGVMSSRFGGDDTRESGTEQEFRAALQRYGDAGQPWVLFYFNDTPPTPKTPADGRRLLKVLEFREELQDKGIVGAYRGVRGSETGFFEQVEQHLRKLLLRIELDAPSVAVPTVSTPRPPGAASIAQPTIPTEYLTWLQTKCAGLDLFGLDLKHGSAAKLQSIYVPLTTSKGADEDDEEGTPGDRGKRRRKKLIRDVDMTGRGREEQPTLLLDRLARTSLYVAGAPGSGKSTFCRWVTWLACQGQMPSVMPIEPPEGYRETWPSSLAGRLPIFVRLRELVTDLSTNPGETLTRTQLEELIASFAHASAEGLTAENARAHIARGTALIVLDGLDEVPLAVGSGVTKTMPRARLVSGLRHACSTWHTAGNRILVTSRPHGLPSGDATIPGLARADVNDLDEPLQGLLVQRWFHQLRIGDERDSFAAGLNGHLAEHGWLAPLSRNPLLLTGMCIVYDEGGRLPQDKHDLYVRIVNTVLNSRYRDDQEARERARYALQAVAFGMHTGEGLGESRVTPEAQATTTDIDRVLRRYLEKQAGTHDGNAAAVQLREELLSQSGLLLSSDDGKAGFYHLSFQEFLAGQRIADVEDDLFPTFDNRSAVPEWHNTLSLLFAGLTKERAKRVLRRLVDALTASPESERIARQTVIADGLDILAARGDRLDAASEAACRQALLATLISDAPAVTRCRIGTTLGRIGDPRFHGPAGFGLPNDPLLGFVHVPGGEFLMGSSKNDDSVFHHERPQHRLTLRDFFVARYPVTVAQFRQFVDARPDHRVDERAIKGGPTHPVTFVSWHDALAYCEWLSEALRGSPTTPMDLKRLLSGTSPWSVTLPSEAEWERAARGTTGRRYPWGDHVDTTRANYDQTRIGGTSPAGAFPKGASVEGELHDMSGNVGEWTRSLWGPDLASPLFKYPYDPRDGREELGASDDVGRVVRGGSLYYDGWDVRAAYRGRIGPGSRDNGLGFRVVVSPFSSTSTGAAG